MKAKGVEFIYLDKAEQTRWQAALKPIYDDMAKKYGEDWNKFMKIRETMLK